MPGIPLALAVPVKLAAIALDYDGTIARHDILDLEMRRAISAARAKGIVIVLVTGRILDELRRVAGDLRFVDVVVAENGAVLHYPDRGITTDLAAPVPDELIAELRRRQVTIGVGRSIIDASAGEATHMLEVVRALELPWVLVFNHGRVMLLPQGVSKATGLKAALDAQRLSPRNTVAIGDAENDHEMLRIAELGVAVEWGSAALRQAADWVLRGTGPAAVAAYIEALAGMTTLPPIMHARRRLRLGYTDEGEEFSLAVRGRNVLVAGDPKSGKSWIAGLLCEQLILQGYCVCVIDPEGDYRSLEGLPGVVVLGGDDPPPTPRELSRALRYPDRSVVIDLSQRSHEEKVASVRTLLPVLNVLRRQTGLPHRIVVDEAHYYLHDADASTLLDLTLNGYTVITYCASRLPEALLQATSVMIVTSESSSVEIDALFRLCQGCSTIDRPRWDVLRGVRVGHAVALPITTEAGGTLRRFTMAPRLTPHVRHRHKYVDVPIGQHQAFAFTAAGGTQRARTLRDFVQALETMPAAQLAPYTLRGDFSRWIEDVFGDRALAHEVRRLEVDGRERAAEVPGEIAAVIRSRYDVRDEPVAT